jgi:hypothetical protein
MADDVGVHLRRPSTLHKLVDLPTKIVANVSRF